MMFFGGFMWLVWILIIGLVVWAVVAFTRRGESPGRSPLEIARERYARGEITREEFEKIKRDLM